MTGRTRWPWSTWRRERKMRGIDDGESRVVEGGRTLPGVCCSFRGLRMVDWVPAGGGVDGFRDTDDVARARKRQSEEETKAARTGSAAPIDPVHGNPHFAPSLRVHRDRSPYSSIQQSLPRLIRQPRSKKLRLCLLMLTSWNKASCDESKRTEYKPTDSNVHSTSTRPAQPH